MIKFYFIFLIYLLLSGCSSVSEQSVKYYIINPVEQQPLISADDSLPLNVRVLDLRIPQYLEHFQIARRTGQQQIAFSDNHQWGENLSKNLVRTLARNLSRQLDSPSVFTPSIRSSSKPDFTITVFIDQFEQDSEGNVQLAARYQISSLEEKSTLSMRVFEQSLSNDQQRSYASMVATMEALFNNLCMEISDSLITIRSHRG